MADIAANEDFPFSYLVAFFQGTDAAPPGSDDAEWWAGQTGLTTPILSDPSQTIGTKMPFPGEAIPARCALDPRMKMLDCYTGEAPDPDPALEAIRADFAARY